MRKFAGIVFFLLLMGIAITFVWINESHYQQSLVSVNGYQLTVDEAQTPDQRKLGLGGRKQMAENQGMLFLYAKEQPLSFWMKDMFMPIDIIWLDKNCRVVYIEKNLLPCPEQGNCPVYTPPVNSQFVLETTAGFSERHQIIPEKTIIKSTACTP